MKYFLEVVKWRNFTKAAEQLYISQPAISRKISQLEKQLGVELINRSQRDFALTIAGERFYTLFKEYLNELHILTNQFSSYSKEVIKFGIFHGWNIPHHLQSHIKLFEESHPEVAFEVSSADVSGLRQGLREGRYQFIIGIDKMMPPEERLTKYSLGEFHRVAVFHETNPLASKMNTSLEELALQPCYLFRDHLMPLEEVVDQPVFKSRNIRPKIVLMDNLESVITALANGNGYTVLDEWQRIVDNKEFCHLALPEKEQMYLAHRDDNSISQITKQFIEEFRNSLLKTSEETY